MRDLSVPVQQPWLSGKRVELSFSESGFESRRLLNYVIGDVRKSIRPNLCPVHQKCVPRYARSRPSLRNEGSDDCSSSTEMVEHHSLLLQLTLAATRGRIQYRSGAILSVESNQNVESKTEKCRVQNNIWSVDSQENH